MLEELIAAFLTALKQIAKKAHLQRKLYFRFQQLYILLRDIIRITIDFSKSKIHS